MPPKDPLEPLESCFVLTRAPLNRLNPGISLPSAVVRSALVPYPAFALALFRWEMKFSFGTLDPPFPYRVGIFLLELLYVIGQGFTLPRKTPLLEHREGAISIHSTFFCF